MGRWLVRSALGIILAVSVWNSEAREWEIVPSIEIEEGYTDNVDLTPHNKQSDFITSIRPGIAIHGGGARSALDLNYTLEGVIFLEDSDQNDLRQQLNLLGQAEIVEDTLFLDAQAFITQGLISNEDASSVSGLTGQNNLTNVYGYNFSPSVRHRFGSWADFETRYTLSQFISGSGASSDTLTNSATMQLTSGDDFPRFLWDTTLSGEFTAGSGNRRSTNRELALVTIQYIVMPEFIPLATFGYERIEDDTLSDEPNGPIGSVGFRSVPGPRTRLQLTYGWRFDRGNLGFDFAYDISSESQFTASFVEGIETTARLASRGLEFLEVDEFGNFVDLHTGLPFDAIEAGFGLNDNDSAFFMRRGEAAITGGFDRNRLSAVAFGETREFDTTGETERVIGANLNWSRPISQRTSLGVNALYTNTDFGTMDDRVDNLFGLNARINYRISENASASLGYARTMRISTEELEEFTENFVSVRVRLQY